MDILKNTAGSILSYNGTPLGTTWEVPSSPSYPTDGLVERWTFDDTLVGDQNSYTWVAQNTPSWSYETGKVNNCLDIAEGGGVGGYFDNTTDSAIYDLVTGTTAFSISLWFKNEAAITGDQYHFLSWEPGPGIMAVSSTTYWATTDGEWGFNRAGTWLKSGVDVCTDLGWHHLCLTFDGTNHVFWTDGVEGATISNTGSINTIDAELTFTANEGSWSSNARFDQMYFYNKKISDADIALLYNGGSGV